MGYQLLEEPFNDVQIKGFMNIAGELSAVVSVDLDDIISGNIEDLNNTVEEKMVGMNVLQDINYDVVGTGLNNEIHIRVTAECILLEEF